MKRATHHGIYKKLDIGWDGNIWRCFYCGSIAETVDHVPPVSRIFDYRALMLKHEFYWRVKCCYECNTVLGNKLQPTLLHRVESLKTMLSKRYKRVLATPEWDSDEINELKKAGKLQKYVREQAELRAIVAARIDCYTWVDEYLLTLEVEE